MWLVVNNQDNPKHAATKTRLKSACIMLENITPVFKPLIKCCFMGRKCIKLWLKVNLLVMSAFSRFAYLSATHQQFIILFNSIKLVIKFNLHFFFLSDLPVFLFSHRFCPRWHRRSGTSSSGQCSPLPGACPSP